MDKSLILKQIKEHYKFKTDGEFADFLGIKQNSLSNWSTRNSIDYDRIISKCEDIDANWLLTGKGEMLKNTYILKPTAYLHDNIEEKKDDKDYIIEIQKKLIEKLENEVKELQKQLEGKTNV